MLDFKELLSIPTEVHFQRFSNSKDTYLIRASKDIQYSIVRQDKFWFLNCLREGQFQFQLLYFIFLWYFYLTWYQSGPPVSVDRSQNLIRRKRWHRHSPLLCPLYSTNWIGNQKLSSSLIGLEREKKASWQIFYTSINVRTWMLLEGWTHQIEYDSWWSKSSQ